jgi:hypothetical protein
MEQILGSDQIEDAGNAIRATMRNLAPPISIFQYYQAFKPQILQRSNLPDIRLKSQFKIMWTGANPPAKDLIVFMWVLKDLIVQKGVVETITTNPCFYLTRFCTGAVIHISQHHIEFYTDIENWNSLPQIEPYDLETTNEIQKMANENFPEFLSALDELAQEETTQLHESIQQHQNLSRKYPDSFPITFQRIQLHGYITRALDDRKNTLEQRQISTLHSRTLLYLPQLDPGSMKIAKRS